MIHAKSGPKERILRNACRTGETEPDGPELKPLAGERMCRLSPASKTLLQVFCRSADQQAPGKVSLFRRLLISSS